jgi:3-hydroxypropanoate dehydrogenase
LNHAANDEALDLIFRQARTYRKFRPDPVTPQILMAVYDLMRLGPTSGNICPARIAFVVSDAAKERLKPHLDSGNVEQTMNAPATAILAYDLAFYNQLPRLRPTRPQARERMMKKSPETIERLALQSGSLQGGYFILAARAIGLDCGPMGGFDKDGVDTEFFAGTTWRSNFLCNLGYADEPDMAPREPRLAFDEACRIL